MIRLLVGQNTFIDSILDKVVGAISKVIELFVSFTLSNNFITATVWLLTVNAIAIVLMKRDKQYAKEEKRRIRESTLLTVALAGGALGMYYAMYKYKHKTLHKQFTICVPLFIVLHFAFILYAIIGSFII